MQDSVVFLVFLPLVLVVIMLGLGLSLTVQDFRNVLRTPKALIVALVLQTIVLPALCLGIAYAFGTRASAGRRHDAARGKSRRNVVQSLQPPGRRRRRVEHHADCDQLGTGHPHAAADRQPVADALLR